MEYMSIRYVSLKNEVVFSYLFYDITPITGNPKADADVYRKTFFWGNTPSTDAKK